MSALQSRPAIQVAPVVFVTQTVVPVVLAPLLLGESFARHAAGGVPLALSLALLVAGAAVLARSPLLLALMERRAASASRAARRASPSDAEPETIRSSPRTEAASRRRSTTTRRRPASGAEAAAPSRVQAQRALTGVAPAVRASTS